MLASPSDVTEERQIAREIILDWNNVHSFGRNITLLPLGWEYNSVPTMGDRPQEIINKQVLKNADLLVGIFWTRIRTPTGKAVSGSVEEIEEHIQSGKPAMLYFSNKPVLPDSIDSEQYNAVKTLKKEFQNKGLCDSFDSAEDFRAKFQRHLPLKLNTEEYFVGYDNEFIPEINIIRETSDELSNEAKTLLVEASQDGHGQIMKAKFKGGISIQTNHKQFIEDQSAKNRALWEGAIEELIGNGLLNSLGYKDQVFSLTNKGFIVADRLKSKVT